MDREGVKIYILLWKEPKVAMDHGSAIFQKQLMGLHPNIKVRGGACVRLLS